MGRPRPGRSKAPRRKERLRERLTKRQLELAHLIAAGHTCKEIAGFMGMSPATLSFMSSAMYEELGLHTWGNARVRLTLLVVAEWRG